MQNYDIKTITSSDALFPSELSLLNPSVTCLYAVGNLGLLRHKHLVAIVGSRKPTPYGIDVTREMAAACTRAGAVVVSGLAYGIDSVAHRAALEAGGQTIAVLPNNLRKIYPKRHKGLAEQIISRNGLILSEYSDDLPQLPYMFVARNRIIAGISKTVIVTEAGLGSGSRHTVEYCVSLGKHFAAVPGSIYNPNSQGTNKLISEGGILIRDSSDLLQFIGLNEKNIKPKFVPENTYQAAIYKVLKSQPSTIQQITQHTDLPAGALNAQLAIMEIKGVTEQNSDQEWRLI